MSRNDRAKIARTWTSGQRPKYHEFQGSAFRILALLVHRSGENAGKWRHAERRIDRRSAQVWSGTLRICLGISFCVARWETLHLKAMAEREGFSTRRHNVNKISYLPTRFPIRLYHPFVLRTTPADFLWCISCGLRNAGRVEETGHFRVSQAA